MLRFIFAILTAFIFFTSCHPHYKKCNCSSKNEEIKAYSEILNEIVDHRSYNLYLGEDEERIFKDYVAHPNIAKVNGRWAIINSIRTWMF